MSILIITQIVFQIDFGNKKSQLKMSSKIENLSKTKKSKHQMK